MLPLGPQNSGRLPDSNIEQRSSQGVITRCWSLAFGNGLAARVPPRIIHAGDYLVEWHVSPRKVAFSLHYSFQDAHIETNCQLNMFSFTDTILQGYCTHYT